MTIRRIVQSTGLLLTILVGASTAISNCALVQLHVGGPNYVRIIAGKDLVADILPPPLYINEAYLEARLALDRPREVQQRKERLLALKKDFDERKAVWDASTLIPVGLRETLTKAAAGEAPPHRMFSIRSWQLTMLPTGQSSTV